MWQVGNGKSNWQVHSQQIDIAGRHHACALGILITQSIKCLFVSLPNRGFIRTEILHFKLTTIKCIKRHRTLGVRAMSTLCECLLYAMSTRCDVYPECLSWVSLLSVSPECLSCVSLRHQPISISLSAALRISSSATLSRWTRRLLRKRPARRLIKSALNVFAKQINSSNILSSLSQRATTGVRVITIAITLRWSSEQFSE